MNEHWVYIYSNTDDIMFIGIATDTGKLMDEKQSGILYLCPFAKAFDALAHKCLLEQLGKPSLQHFIARNRLKTETWITLLKNFNSKLKHIN